MNLQNPLRIISLLLLVILASTSVEASDRFCRFEPVSQTVYVINGSNADTCPARTLQHPVTNPVAIIGESGVILVDPGSSQQVGRLVVNRLRLITEKPVVAIINTHIHGLYWLANDALKQAFPDTVIYAHQKMIDRIENGEGLFWLAAITGKGTGPITRIAAPEQPLSDGELINLNGIDLKVHHPGHAHTDHDLLVEVVEDRVLILGGLVVEPEVPSQGVPEDANFKGQMAATQYVIGLNMQRYIPGQGDVQGIVLPQRGLRFLQALYSGVEQYYSKDLTDYEITARLKSELSAYKRWYHFEALGRVISEIYSQVEQERF